MNNMFKYSREQIEHNLNLSFSSFHEFVRDRTPRAEDPKKSKAQIPIYKTLASYRHKSGASSGYLYFSDYIFLSVLQKFKILGIEKAYARVFLNMYFAAEKIQNNVFTESFDSKESTWEIKITKVKEEIEFAKLSLNKTSKSSEGKEKVHHVYSTTLGSKHGLVVYESDHKKYKDLTEDESVSIVVNLNLIHEQVLNNLKTMPEKEN